MRNFKLIVEYDGAAFNGWQTQAAVDEKGQVLRTIQSHLEDKIENIFKKKIHCHASGRTDSGVHALGQVVHFKADTTIEPALIHRALNNFLDKDLSIVKVEEVGLDFHSQMSVKDKTYRYTVLNRSYPSALWRDRAYFYPNKLNVTAMRKAAAHLKGKHDFKGFQSASERSKRTNTVRTVSALTITKEGDLLHITITANGFLYKMVRNIVGALLAVGNGRMEQESVLKILKGKDRKLAPRTAPASGLCLVEVRY